MPEWTNCTVDIYYENKPAYMDDEGYIVRLSDKTIEVAYDDDDGPVVYRGKNKGDGHFDLLAPERQGHASLHQFPESNFLEGYWVEDDVKGMWRIRLGKLLEV